MPSLGLCVSRLQTHLLPVILTGRYLDQALWPRRLKLGIAHKVQLPLRRHTCTASFVLVAVETLGALGEEASSDSICQ